MAVDIEALRSTTFLEKTAAVFRKYSSQLSFGLEPSSHQTIQRSPSPDITVTTTLLEFLTDTNRETTPGVEFVGNTMLFHEGNIGIEVRDPIQTMQPDIEYSLEPALSSSSETTNNTIFSHPASLAGQTS